MSQETRAVAAAWLKEQGQRSLSGGVDEDEFNMLRGLIGSTPFGIFFSLLAQLRAEAQVVLSNVPLGTPERDAVASVLQGQIRTVDQIRDLLLDIADPQKADAAQPDAARSE